MNWPFQPLLPGAAQLEAPRTLTAEAGAFALNGQALSLRIARRLIAGHAPFALAGGDASYSSAAESASADPLDLGVTLSL